MNIAVILAGGRGLRLGGNIPKQMLTLGDKPVISWSVDTFHNNLLIERIIIVSEKSLISELKIIFPTEKYQKIFSFIEGGRERSDSSYNAIKRCECNNDDIILFHDAARPFVSDEIINQMIERVKIHGACGAYINATDTVTVIEDSFVRSIPDRKSLYYAQTPQGFRYSIIKEAHEKYRSERSFIATDDISLVLNLGYAISSIEGSSDNIKITDANDLNFAQFIIHNGKKC